MQVSVWSVMVGLLLVIIWMAGIARLALRSWRQAPPSAASLRTVLIQPRCLAAIAVALAAAAVVIGLLRAADASGASDPRIAPATATAAAILTACLAALAIWALLRAPGTPLRQLGLRGRTLLLLVPLVQVGLLLALTVGPQTEGPPSQRLQAGGVPGMAPGMALDGALDGADGPGGRRAA